MYYQAFMDLTSCRGQGYGTEGPISWFSIQEYADRKRFSCEQREDLEYFIPKLDAAYLEFKGKKLESKLAQKSPVGKARGRK